MAIYSRPQGVSAFKGSSGGVTFQKSGPSSAVRLRRVPRNRRTINTSKSRMRFTGVASQWHTLNSTEKTSFDTKAPQYQVTNSLGESITLGANALFQRFNIPMSKTGIPIITTAIDAQAFPSHTVDSVIMEVAPAEIAVNLDPATVPIDFMYTVAVSAPRQTPYGNPDSVTLYDQKQVLEDTSTDINWIDGWVDSFGDNFVYNNQFVVIGLRQLNLSTGEQRYLFRQNVEINA